MSTLLVITAAWLSGITYLNSSQQQYVLLAILIVTHKDRCKMLYQQVE